MALTEREKFELRCFVETFGIIPTDAQVQDDPVNSVQLMRAEWLMQRCDCGLNGCTGWRLVRREE